MLNSLFWLKLILLVWFIQIMKFQFTKKKSYTGLTHKNIENHSFLPLFCFLTCLLNCSVNSFFIVSSSFFIVALISAMAVPVLQSWLTTTLPSFVLLPRSTFFTPFCELLAASAHTTMLKMKTKFVFMSVRRKFLDDGEKGSFVRKIQMMQSCCLEDFGLTFWTRIYDKNWKLILSAWRVIIQNVVRPVLTYKLLPRSTNFELIAFSRFLTPFLLGGK